MDYLSLKSAFASAILLAGACYATAYADDSAINLLSNAIPSSSEYAGKDLTAAGWQIFDRNGLQVSTSEFVENQYPAFAEVNASYNVLYNNKQYFTGDKDHTGLEPEQIVALLNFPDHTLSRPTDMEYFYEGLHYSFPIEVPQAGEYELTLTAERILNFNSTGTGFTNRFTNMVVTFDSQPTAHEFGIVKVDGANEFQAKDLNGTLADNLRFTLADASDDASTVRVRKAKFNLTPDIKYISFYGPGAVCLLANLSLTPQFALSSIDNHNLEDDYNCYYDVYGRFVGRDIDINALSPGLYIRICRGTAIKILK